jgi:hypothetical protein
VVTYELLYTAAFSISSNGGNIMSNNKTKKITFRVESRVYDWLNDFATEKRIDISQVCRGVIISYFFSKFLGEFHSNGLSKRFFSKFPPHQSKKVKK